VGANLQSRARGSGEETIRRSALPSIGRSFSSAWRLALRNLLQDRLRFALTVLAVGLPLMLILFLLGLRAGARRSAVVYLDNAPGSVAVLPQGARTTAAGSARFLAPEVADKVASTAGVGGQ